MNIEDNAMKKYIQENYVSKTVIKNFQQEINNILKAYPISNYEIFDKINYIFKIMIK